MIFLDLNFNKENGIFEKQTKKGEQKICIFMFFQSFIQKLPVELVTLGKRRF